MAASNVKEFKLLVLSYEANGGGTLEFYTDMPGDAMSLRKSDSTKIVNTSGTRETLRWPLDGLVGQLYKLKAIPDSGTQLKLFEGEITLKEIGLFRDGACGEYFETEELS